MFVFDEIGGRKGLPFGKKFLYLNCLARQVNFGLAGLPAMNPYQSARCEKDGFPVLGVGMDSKFPDE